MGVSTRRELGDPGLEQSGQRGGMEKTIDLGGKEGYNWALRLKLVWAGMIGGAGQGGQKWHVRGHLEKRAR